MTPKPIPAKLRILVVDNEPASTRLVRLTLEKHDLFEVCEVNDPKRALAAAHRFHPGLILLDVEMPTMDGIEVARVIHAQNDFRNVPIVFMTSLITEQEARRNITCNGTYVMAKPVTVGKLAQFIAERLSSLCENDGNPLPTNGPCLTTS